MTPNPALGVFLHWLGGLASGSFYVPYRGVKHWAWETFWLAGGIFSWIIAPWLLGLLITKDLGAVLSESPKITLFWTFFFGLLWGIGGLTFGLTMRYLGLSLGMAVVFGLCAAFWKLMPPVFFGGFLRSGEGRVGEEGRFRGVPGHLKKKKILTFACRDVKIKCTIVDHVVSSYIVASALLPLTPHLPSAGPSAAHGCYKHSMLSTYRYR